MKHRKTVWAASLLVVPLSLLGWAWAADYGHMDVDKAKRRLHSVLGQVEPAASPSIKDVRRQPEIPDLNGVKHRVPEFKYYGHDRVVSDPMEVAKRYQSKIPDKAKAKQADLLAFVSFSMPEASLRRIAAETAKVGGVMVIRGFKDGSLKRTIAATQELAALQGELLIHPELFDQYAVAEVPTFVLAASGAEMGGNCSENEEFGVCSEHLQVKGDVSLHSALEYFVGSKPQGKLGQIAQAKLDMLQRGGR